jgi:hypothetical protein
MNLSTQHKLLGFAAGVAAAAALPVLLPILRDVARPFSKAVLKHGWLGLDAAQTMFARASETIEDLFAEVRAEVEVELSGRVQQAAVEPAAAPERVVVTNGNGASARVAQG